MTYFNLILTICYDLQHTTILALSIYNINCTSYLYFITYIYRSCLSSFQGTTTPLMMAITCRNMLGKIKKFTNKSYYYLDAFVGYFTSIFTVASNICGLSEWNLFRVTFLAPINMMWTLEFWEFVYYWHKILKLYYCFFRHYHLY
jgi:hypothetical protein